MSTDKEEESFYRPSNIRNQMLVHGGLTFKRAKAVQLSNIRFVCTFVQHRCRSKKYVAYIFLMS